MGNTAKFFSALGLLLVTSLPAHAEILTVEGSSSRVLIPGYPRICNLALGDRQEEYFENEIGDGGFLVELDIPGVNSYYPHHSSQSFASSAEIVSFILLEDGDFKDAHRFFGTWAGYTDLSDPIRERLVEECEALK